MDQIPIYEELKQRLFELEKALIEKRDYELISNSVSISVIVLDPEQNILSANAAAEKLLGLKDC